MTPRPKYGIGSEATINGQLYRVVRYHRVLDRWEVMFRHLGSGKHVSLSLLILETHDYSEN